MRMSDLIAAFIADALRETDGNTELRRSDLAARFGCVPSQINYVIATRFTPEHGYVVESRRGGGGFIRISRVQVDPGQLLMHTLNAVGDTLDLQTAGAFLQNLMDADVVSLPQGRLMSASVGDAALRPVPLVHRGAVRASIFKQLLLAIES